MSRLQQYLESFESDASKTYSKLSKIIVNRIDDIKTQDEIFDLIQEYTQARIDEMITIAKGGIA